MEHTDIAPLARRLAEENNVEWRRLRGSGERGRVVERDVLEYLARVMAGEEDLDPTPEPVPEGMQAWPEEDVRAFEQEKRGETVPPAFGMSTVDDEIFLLDADGDDLDGDIDVEEPGASYGAVDYAADASPAYARPDAHTDEDVELAPMEGVIEDIADEDDLLVAGDDPAPTETAMIDARTPAGAAEPAEHAPDVFASNDEDPELLPDLFDDRPSEAAWDDAPVFGDDGLGVFESASPGPSLDMDDDEEVLGSGGGWGASDEGPSAFEDDEDAHAPVALEPDAGVDGTPAAAGAGALDGDGSEWDQDESDAFAHEQVPAGPLQDAGADWSAEAPREAPPAEAGAAYGDPAPADTTRDDMGRDDLTLDDSGRDDLALEDSASDDPALDDPAPHATSSDDTVPIVVPIDPRALDDGDPRRETQGVVAGSGGASLPLVSHGAVFRRQVDLSHLVAAQGDVARDLGLDEPVPLVAFLARAAAKARGEGPAVGVAVFHDQAVRTVSIDVAAGAFADVVAAFAGLAEAPDARADDLDLVVADLADLDLDEAVLHLGAPVLAVGRVLIDTSTGGRRATLTLSGPGIGREAAGILARTAELLETPIRVVL